MDFQFVVQTGTEDGKHAAKKTVRSQAMKAYRKRQRAERIAASGPDSGQAASSRELQSKQTLPTLVDELSRPEHASRMQTGETVVVFDIERSKKTSNGRASARHHEHGRGAVARRKFAGAMIRNPAMWSADPFASAADIDKMISFAATYVHWLRPDVTADHAAKVCAKAWTTSPCPMLMSACCMAASVDLNTSSQPLAFHKSRVLRELADRMLFTETATSDETISALVFLASAELSKASLEARTHLKGLHIVLYQRFGTKNGHQIPDARFARVTQTLEMTSALMFDEYIYAPDFTELPLHRVCDQLNDILVGEQLEYLSQSAQTRLDEVHIRPIFALVHKAFACISILSELKESSNAASQAFWDSLEDFRENNCKDKPEGSVVRPAARANYHANAILYNLVTNHRPFRHGTNSRHVGGLVTALQASSSLSWRFLPFLQLFVILIGLTAARDAGPSSELKRHLWAAVFASLSWLKMRRFMLLFVAARDKLHAIFAPESCRQRETAASPPDIKTFYDAVPSPSSALPLAPENRAHQQKSSQIETTVTGRRSAEEMLDADHRFHEVIRDGGCWLTEIE